MYSKSNDFSIGDIVLCHDDANFYTVIGLEVRTYFGKRGNVSTNMILYLGGGLWKSANHCTKMHIEKRKSR